MTFDGENVDLSLEKRTASDIALHRLLITFPFFELLQDHKPSWEPNSGMVRLVQTCQSELWGTKG